MRLAVFFALDDEFVPFRNLARPRASQFRLLSGGRFAERLGLRFEHGGHEVVVANTGSGGGHAWEWALADEFAQCDWFLAAGLAGALTPNLEAGDVVIASNVWQRKPGDFQLVHATTEIQLPFTVALPADVITVDHVLVTRTEKAGLLQVFRHDGRAAAVIADMESAAIARAAREQRARFAAVRAISDTAHEDLPLDFNDYLGADGNLHRARIIRQALARPSLIRPLSRLGRNSRLACLRLAEVVWQWIDQVARSEK